MRQTEYRCTMKNENLAEMAEAADGGERGTCRERDHLAALLRRPVNPGRLRSIAAPVAVGVRCSLLRTDHQAAANVA
ncbi:hypothetical protein MRX96_058300 [Rhipicephalus microplus]